MVRDQWLDHEDDLDAVDWLSTNKGRLFSAWEIAKRNLVNSEAATKQRYDQRTTPKDFQVGDLVLVCSPTVTGSLSARFIGPYPVLKKVTCTNYILSTPDRRKKQTIVHINMIKKYQGRDIRPVTIVATKEDGQEAMEDAEKVLSNSEILYNLQTMLTHVTEGNQPPLVRLIQQFKTIFRDALGLTSVLRHDVILNDGVRPIKQHPYRLNPRKKEVVKR